MSGNSSTKHGDPFNQIQKHSKYFIPDGDVYLRAGSTLFCVHSYFLTRDSPRFQAMLTAPVAPNVTREGSSESNPIPIAASTSPSEFAKFLWVFYNDTYSNYTATVAEWTSILKISCEYHFNEVKHCAIRGLQQCDLTLIERIHIYVLYEVDLRYLVPLYAQLCARDHGLDDTEISKLGQATSLKIFRLRERIRSTSHSENRSPLPDGVDALDAICEILQVDRGKIPDNGHGSSTTTKGNNINGNHDVLKGRK